MNHLPIWTQSIHKWDAHCRILEEPPQVTPGQTTAQGCIMETLPELQLVNRLATCCRSHTFRIGRCSQDIENKGPAEQGVD